MNTIHGEWVRCTKCIYVEDCDTKEDRDGCYFGETERTARWKGAGMGEYYCSFCCEVGDVRERECPNCHAQMYTDKERERALAEWEAEDETERAFWSLEGIV
jgi:hypothetical protein